MAAERATAEERARAELARFRGKPLHERVSICMHAHTHTRSPSSLHPTISASDARNTMRVAVRCMRNVIAPIMTRACVHVCVCVCPHLQLLEQYEQQRVAEEEAKKRQYEEEVKVVKHVRPHQLIAGEVIIRPQQVRACVGVYMLMCVQSSLAYTRALGHVRSCLRLGCGDL